MKFFTVQFSNIIQELFHLFHRADSSTTQDKRVIFLWTRDTVWEDKTNVIRTHATGWK